MAQRVSSKICGLTDFASVASAVAGGASFLGFVFYPPSPRYVTPNDAARLVAEVPDGVEAVGVLVDPDDDLCDAITDQVPLGLLQLHGGESPERVVALRARYGVPVIKAVQIAGGDDVAAARAYRDVADWLMFDAKPPAVAEEALPGGNGVAFAWELLRPVDWLGRWILSGGLDAENVAEATRISGARAVDVSSGVERSPGDKDPQRIKAFLDAVRRL